MKEDNYNIKEIYDDKRDELKEDVANNIMRTLKTKNITQKQLAYNIGIAESSISRALRAEREFNVYEIKCIAEFLNITIEEIITGIAPENKKEHIRTTLNNSAINWLKSLEPEKEYLLEIVNLILGNKEIAETIFEAVCLYAVSDIAHTYFKKEGTVNERQARFIADDELLLRYAIVGSFEEILKLIKKEYRRYPNNYFQRINEEKINKMCKSLGNNLRIVKNKSCEIDVEYGEDISEYDKEANEYNKIKDSH